MGDGTADGVRVDSLAEWQAAAEEVRRLERVAQGRREVLLSAARADALAQGELGAGRRLLAGLERALVEGTALAGPSPVKHGLNATRGQIRSGEVRKVPVEDWGGADFAIPAMTLDELLKTGDHITEHLKPGDQVRMDDSPAAISAVNEAGRTASIETVTSAPKVVDANLGSDIYWGGSLKQDVHGRVETTGPTKLQPAKPRRGPPVNHIEPITSREAKIVRKAREASDPADYWSGKARNPRRWWQFWRKK